MNRLATTPAVVRSRMLLLVLLLGCPTPDKDADPLGFIDGDGDGFAAEDDCNDANAAIHPDAGESCDDAGVDEDCDGLVNDDDADDLVDGTTMYVDRDNDQYGDPASPVTACEEHDRTFDNDGDCNDEDNDINPGEDELCDGIDNNCDGEVDEAGAEGAPTWYDDLDGDGYGDSATEMHRCEQPEGSVSEGGDCDDAVATVSPGVVELCDGIDNNCDGASDEDTAADAQTWFIDSDADGYGTTAYTVVSCIAPGGMVANPYDCDDTNPNTHPGADEYCDGNDDNCDGVIDEGSAVDAEAWFADGDGDGFGAAASATSACSVPAGYTADDTDCDDTDANENPFADEYCDGDDDNCDGEIDEYTAVDAGSWYPDDDVDGSGYLLGWTVSCIAPAGYLSSSGDCDDTDATEFPGADERCDGDDDDCDGAADEADAIDAATWYADADSDGWGDEFSTTPACDQPVGYLATDGDCDDTDGATNPDADEVCGGGDENCDGSIDEATAVDALSWYVDVDGDGYGKVGSTATAGCTQPSGYAASNDDCNDTTAAVNPGEAETCDGVDNDCNGATDEDAAIDVVTWYRDVDRDGYGVATTTDVDCDQPVGYAGTSDDCDDTDDSVNPGEAEVCDAADVDEDCNGLADDLDAGVTGEASWYTDGDGDGYGAGALTLSCDPIAGLVSTGGDCDDGEAAMNPGETEVCNDGLDNDCSGDRAPCEWTGVDATTAASASFLGDHSSELLGYGLGAGDMDDDGSEDLLVFSKWDRSTSSLVGGIYVYDRYETGTSLSALDQIVRGSSSTAKAYFGMSTGDADGDGDDDLLVGMSSTTNATGVYLMAGPITAVTSVSSATASFSSSVSSDAWGDASATGGDIDGDGRMEIAVGGIGYDYSSTSGVGGVAWIESASGAYTTSTVGALLRGSSANDNLGSALAFVDFNGDGADELFAGAQYAGTFSQGKVYMASGALTTGTMASSADATFDMASGSYGYYLGNDLTPAGDLDGDGYDDLVVGGHGLSLSGRRGGAVVLSGGASLPSGTVNWYTRATALIGGPSTSTSSYFGYGVAVPGDVDGDGERDLVVTAPYYDYSASSQGTTYLFLGPFSGNYDTDDAVWTVTGPSSSDNLGRDVVGLDDLDADGFADFAVSSSEYSSDLGAAWLVLGLGE